MATTRFNTVGSATNATAVVSVLEKRLHQEILNDTFFSAFRGIFKPAQEAKAPGAIITTMNQLTAGSDEIIITMRRNYTGEPITGDTQLLGTEEDFAFRFEKIKVGEKAKAFTIPKKGISAQRVKWMNLAREVKPAASDWWKLEEDFEIFKAFYRGASPHTIDEADVNAQGGLTRSHPNFFAAGDTGGKDVESNSSTTPGTTAYEDAVADAIDAVTDIASDRFGLKLLDVIAVLVRTSEKLKPLNIGGRSFWIVLLHPNQVAQIQQENNWQTLVQNADVRGRQNASFAARRLFPDAEYKQLLIWEHEHIMGATTSGSDPTKTVNYGSSTPHAALDTNNVKISIVFGEGAIAEAIPEPIHFETEMRDYNRKWGLGSLTIRGVKRMDWSITDDGAGQAATLNQSSLNFATFSDSPAFITT